MKLFTLALAATALGLSPATAQTTPQTAPAAAAEDAPWPEAWFEIFKLAPGTQEEFIRRIARADEVSAAGGQPPIQLFFHENGADFDVILFKPVTGAKPTPAQEAAMAAKSKELGMESGPAYFVKIRELVAEHTDSKTYGPPKILPGQRRASSMIDRRSKATGRYLERWQRVPRRFGHAGCARSAVCSFGTGRALADSYELRWEAIQRSVSARHGSAIGRAVW